MAALRFPTAEIHAILDGRKQQFRVPTGLPTTRFNPSAKTHAVMPDQIDLTTRKPVECEPYCHLIVVEHRIEPLSDITAGDAKAEGFTRVEQFWRAFIKRWGMTDWAAAYTDVHVVQFEVDLVERQRFLPLEDGRKLTTTYVGSGAPDVALMADPAVPPHFQDQLSKQAEFRNESLREARREEASRDWRALMDRVSAEIAAFDAKDVPEVRRLQRKAQRLLQEKPAA